MTNKIIYTIGHSTHQQEYFLHLLKQNSVTCIVDVRSNPHSARVPQFNKEDLRRYLEGNDIVYLHFPKSFGARQQDPGLLDEDGRVDFEKVRQTDQFRQGVDKLRYCLGQGHVISLMCAEADPLYCHRFSMVAFQLIRDGFQVRHILKDGSGIDNNELEKRLLTKYSQKLAEQHLFESNHTGDISKLELAYKFNNKEIGYVVKRFNEPKVGTNVNKEPCRLQLYTIGFTNKTAQRFFHLLQTHQVKKIVDTRLNNISQLSGFAKGRDLEFFAKAICNVAYSHELTFAPTKILLEKYRKKLISWDEYAIEYLNLLEERKVGEQINIGDLHQSCLLCSEHTADKCHRRLLAEYLMGKYPEIEVIHLR